MYRTILKTLNNQEHDKDQIQNTLEDLHKSFATLTQEEQKYANIFLHDIQSGNARLVSGKTFKEYITQYQFNAKNYQIRRVSEVLGVEETKLRNMMNIGITELNLNEFGRFDDLKNTVDKNKAKEYFEKLEGKTISDFKVNIKVHNLLQKFVISGGFEI